MKFEEKPPGNFSEEHEPKTSQRSSSERIKKLVRIVGMAGALIAGQEAAGAPVEASHGVEQKRQLDQKEEERNREVTGWLQEIGMRVIDIELDRRASNLKGEAYHIKIAIGDEKGTIMDVFVGNPNPFDKNTFQEKTMLSLERAIDYQAFQKRIKVYPAASKIMEEHGIRLYGSSMTLDSRNLKGGKSLDLYNNGRNESATFTTAGNDLILDIVTKKGELHRYVIRDGSLLNRDSNLPFLEEAQ